MPGGIVEEPLPRRQKRQRREHARDYAGNRIFAQECEVKVRKQSWCRATIVFFYFSCDYILIFRLEGPIPLDYKGILGVQDRVFGL